MIAAMVQPLLFAVLWMLNFIIFYPFILYIVNRQTLLQRLNAKQGGEQWRTFQSKLFRKSGFQKFTLLLEASGIQLKWLGFLYACILLMLIGIMTGVLFFQSVKGVVITGTMMALLPFIVLRLKLLGLQLQARMDFLPAVEVVYQYYILGSPHSLITALQTTLEEQRITHPIRAVFERFYRNIVMKRELEECLSLFVISLGHLWALHFISIVRVALLEGNDVSRALKELIDDMRRAKRTDQAERNRLLEIRIANFTPILFLLLFMFVNFQMNYDSSLYYYFMDPEGRNLLLDALLIIFASFLMGIYLSVKRM